MKPKIFVDGQEGTTGLRINEYLAARSDIDILRIDSDKRKDPTARKQLLNAADVVFLCLPDVASREAVALIDNPSTRVIDASTAFRTDPEWAYGLPEISKAQREKIRAAQRVAVPGCHASAFILPIAPLVAAGIVRRDADLTCFSITGYSGGGKKMIAQYEDSEAPQKLRAPRHYALKLTHKHLPEMQVIAGLAHAPYFTPVVCNVHSGLAVETFLPAPTLSGPTTPEQLHKILAQHYAGEQFVRVMPFDTESGMSGGLDDSSLDITACNGTNRADIFICGHPLTPPTSAAASLPAQIAMLCRLDNLGKGAAGAAIQCLNLMLGTDEAAGLRS